MGKERPQLNLDDLHGLRWLLGGVLALVAIWSTAFLEVNAWALIGLATGGILAVLLRPAWPARISPWVHRLAFPAVVTFFVVDYYTFRELLPALVRLGILLVGYRACTHRQRRDDLQLILVSLLLVVTTGVLTVSIAFAGQIVVTAGLALALLLTRTLIDAGEPAALSNGATRALAWTHLSARGLLRRLWRVSDWRVGVAALLLFAALVAFSGTLFLAIPRYQLENSLFLDRWMNKKSVTGFSDTLRFGDVSDIEKDESVAMRVEISDPSKLPAELYWRMIVLDEYHDRTFRLSTYEREHAFDAETTKSRVGILGLPRRAPNMSWTFYVEPGVSRFLPLTGGFVHMSFTEPQSFRTSGRLCLVMLANDPATIKAYRVEKMDTSGTFQSQPVVTPNGVKWYAPPTTIALPFDEAQQARWRGLAREIDPSGGMTAEQFSGAAIRWLHERHDYSLRSAIPPGPEEPLLRWVLSNQPGHCELFAGAFTMLARSEGFPCRVVAGFLGGDWNGDYLIVKNSHAHAWCEMLDRAGSWVRIDPTAAANQSGAKVDPVSDFGGRAQAAHGFGAQWDRLRMLWYRHIVNFDQQDQVDIVRALRGQTDTSAGRLRAAMERLRAFLKKVVQSRWDWARWREIGEGAAVVGLTAWLVYRLRRAVSSSRWVLRRRKTDPIRAEAARWLAQLRNREMRDATLPGNVALALQRIRFGRRETWPDVASTFREARQTWKRLKR